ncbi:MAG: hypothetical protein PVI78_08290 [Anaerolineales bacterium]|jgi:hypothetical protein
MERRIGTWAFIAGILLCVLAGLGQLKEAWPIWLLGALGLVVGWLNIRTRETREFLLAAIALNFSANAFQILPAIGDVVTEILSNIAVFISAALLFIAARVIILRLSKTRIYVMVVAGLALLLAIALAASVFITGDLGDWLETNRIIPWLLPALGIVIGVVYVTRGPTTEGEDDVFILSVLSLQLSAGSLNQVPAIGAFLTEFFLNVVSTAFAVLLVVAFVTVFRILDKQVIESEI